jgi:sugar lactone lactonase YvrE
VQGDLGGDMSLNKLLIAEEGWQVLAEGFGFADGLSGDKEGNLYVNDLKGGGTWRVAADGGKLKLTEVNGSGAKRAPDGRVIYCQGKQKRLGECVAE